MTKTIQTDNAVLVEVPEGATKFEIYDKESLPMAILAYIPSPQFNNLPMPVPIVIPEGNYEILGLLNTVPNDYIDDEIVYAMRDNKMVAETTLILKKVN